MNIFSHLFILSLCAFMELKWVSYRQDIIRCFFLFSFFKSRDFPVCSVVLSLHAHCRGHRATEILCQTEKKKKLKIYSATLCLLIKEFNLYLNSLLIGRDSLMPSCVFWLSCSFLVPFFFSVFLCIDGFPYWYLCLLPFSLSFVYLITLGFAL